MHNTLVGNPEEVHSQQISQQFFLQYCKLKYTNEKYVFVGGIDNNKIKKTRYL